MLDSRKLSAGISPPIKILRIKYPEKIHMKRIAIPISKWLKTEGITRFSLKDI